MIEIAPGISIGEEELELTATRSGGPGGQHVNKTATRVLLRFDLAGSPSLTGEQKRRIALKLKTRIGKDGRLRVVAQESRSQSANRETALARLVVLLRGALEQERPRVETKVPRVEKTRRLEVKKRRSAIKAGRTLRGEGD